MFYWMGQTGEGLVLEVLGDEYRYWWKGCVYGSKRDLERALGMSFERMFSLVGTELFGFDDALRVQLNRSEWDRLLTGEVGKRVLMSWVGADMMVEKNQKRGIDLGGKSGRKGAVYKADEVRKLLFAGFRGKMLSQGYDPEDVLQEVYRGLLVRNQGTCPYEEGKGSFGHYVHMVISCILTNYHRKHARKAEREVSMYVPQDGSDIGQWGVTEEVGGEDKWMEQELLKYLDTVGDDVYVEGAKVVMPYVLAGWKRGEISVKTGMSEQMVTRSMTCLRKATAAWAKEHGYERHVPERFHG